MANREIRDRNGKVHFFRPLGLAELIEVERRLGGSLTLHGDRMTYADAQFILASALSMKEDDVIPLFDGPSALRALVTILAENKA